MRSAGIDIGSRAIKLVLWDGGRVELRAVVDTGSDLLAAAVGHPLRVPESPQTVAALGCALHGAAERR